MGKQFESRRAMLPGEGFARNPGSAATNCAPWLGCRRARGGLVRTRTVHQVRGVAVGFTSRIVESHLDSDCVAVLPLEAELEEPDRVRAPDLHAVGFADACRVEPFGRVVDVLERPVGREEDAV